VKTHDVPAIAWVKLSGQRRLVLWAQKPMTEKLGSQPNDNCSGATAG
jgi:hypothetical protein